MLYSVVVLALHFGLNFAFPQSGNPIMVTAPLQQSPDAKTCSIVLLTANCSSYYEVTVQPVVISDSCVKADWSKLFLSFEAQEQGIIIYIVLSKSIIILYSRHSV